MLFAVLLYLVSFWNGWTLDDFPVIVENPDIRGVGAFFRDSYSGRPLREVSYLLDYALFGLSPVGYHVQNIFWHGLNGVLSYAVVLEVGGRPRVAVTSALLFLAHPLAVEVVANTSHRKDSLALACMLSALLVFNRAVRQKQRRTLNVVLGLGALVLGLLAKQNVAVFPFFLGVFLLLGTSRVEALSRKVLAVVAVGLSLAAGGIYGILLSVNSERFFAIAIPVFTKMNKTLLEGDFSSYLAMVAKSVGFMAGKLFWPYPLAVEYAYTAPSSWWDVSVWCGITVLALLLAGVVLAHGRSRLAGLACLWLLMAWVPVSNLWPFSYFAADRYMYTPLVGFAILVALFADQLLKRRQVYLSVVAVLMMIWGGLTIQQVRVWKSPESLWLHALQVNPESTTVLNNVGAVYLGKNELAKARVYFEKATVNMNDPLSFYNLGEVEERLGRREQALRSYRFFLMFNDPRYQPKMDRLRMRLFRQYGVRM